jgi:hypothetical protein
LTEEELGSYNTLVHSTAKVHYSSVFFPQSVDSQVDALPANFQPGKDDVIEVVGDPTSPAASSPGDCSSPTSGTGAVDVLAAVPASGIKEAGGVPCGGAENPKGTATSP